MITGKIDYKNLSDQTIYEISQILKTSPEFIRAIIEIIKPEDLKEIFNKWLKPGDDFLKILDLAFSITDKKILKWSCYNYRKNSDGHITNELNFHN